MAIGMILNKFSDTEEPNNKRRGKTDENEESQNIMEMPKTATEDYAESYRHKIKRYAVID